ncbi:putative bifunctional diguanylate cyclase/phosphodiesterase [Cognatiluteimonas weifangensis]|uniref:EAL domain-containing protein n=1 Tax=Cognatiluteimonas weifangensis TaxID=2303539 RepID=A0A372DR45_9GAMM|nr:EAL domain-containing protein [Luteimonas weifangensis]RFP62023.1 EAL domain-containing protein [Luteimonas weifangensis]
MAHATMPDSDHAPSPPGTAPDAAQAADELDDLVGMAARLLDTPFASIAIADGAHFRIAAQRGLEGVAAIPREHAICRALGPRTPLLQVGDARADARFRNDALVLREDGIRFYLGAALLDARGRTLGVLNVADRQARTEVDDGTLAGIRQLARIAARLVEQRLLQRSQRIAERLAHDDYRAVIVADADGVVCHANAAAAELFDGTIAAGAALASLFPDDLQRDADGLPDWLRAPLHPGVGAGMPETRDLRIATRDGGVRTLEATRLPWHADEQRGMALLLHDVTGQRMLRARQARMASKDELTGLSRRTAFLSALSALLAGGAHPLGVALVGLDSFRTINDTLGHTIGDAVLQVVAARLQAGLPAGAQLARFGGDEFALLYPQTDGEAIDAQLRAVLLELARPCQVDQHMVHIEASVGAAMADATAGSDELIARADLAMQRAKRNGGRQLCYFEPGMRTEALDRRQLDLELRRACRDEEFELHYQPQVCLSTGMPTGAEALLRWRHPQRGLLAPDKFIDALAQSSVGPAVGRWILERACQDAATWPIVDGRRLAVGVNLFPVQLDHERLPNEVEHALTRSGLTAAHLELELTEKIALGDDDGSAADALAALRARGIRVAYDDFGTGYASLSILRRLPVDRVKIDRSFVRDILANRGDAAIVRSILLIARNFDLRVIAEGVETREQAELLHGLGCQEAQGYLYSPALPPREFARWLAARLRSASLQQMSVAGHA